MHPIANSIFFAKSQTWVEEAHPKPPIASQPSAFAFPAPGKREQPGKE
jgi:hypothetical protein